MLANKASLRYTRNMLTKVHPSYSLVLFLGGIVAGCIFTLVTRQVFITSPIWLVFAGVALILTFFRPIPAMLLLSFVAGFTAINYRASFDFAGQDYFQNLVGETVTITGTISEDPDTSDTKTAVRLTSLQTAQSQDQNQAQTQTQDKTQQVPGTLYLQMSPNRELQRSDRLTVTGKISSGFGTFAGTIYRPTVKNIERPEPGDVFLKVRNWFAGNIKQYLSDEESALGLGYLLGMRSSLPSGLDEKLRIVGLTHIIVASGANLSILIGFSRKFFGKISRFTGLFVSIFLVLSYVGIVGLAPSMTRAGLVSVLSLLAWYVGREFKPWRILLIVAALTLLISPTYIIDLGWLLSFASFAGILILGPALTKFFYGDKEPKILGATLLETVSASLLCTPIILYFFGSFSFISLLANLLILPTISAAMALTFATGLLFFFPPAAQIFGFLSHLLLSFHLGVINFLGEQNLFLLQIPAENPQVFWLYLFIIPLIYVTIRQSRKQCKLGRKLCLDTVNGPPLSAKRPS